jgi:hypothetical protein
MQHFTLNLPSIYFPFTKTMPVYPSFYFPTEGGLALTARVVYFAPTSLLEQSIVKLAKSFYSMRLVVRCRAKQRLLIDPDYSAAIESIDDGLLKELAATLFHTEEYQPLTAGCDSEPELAKLENALVAELVATYLTLWQQRSQPMIQQLNSLL